ncbi:hypothetical protein [Pseudomonas sp. A-RE-19]|uniref:hypothetical protein n=1 Tax=Pseudomonas sp. A-RE-19 TaxID=2832401 RepID=UPI001CC0DAFC|nr:hypothetical protein [Pseudomonas sp. A-RE-19]
MDKAISWPLSQENGKTALAEALWTGPRLISIPNPAPLEGTFFDQAPLLRAMSWSKNEQ